MAHITIPTTTPRISYTASAGQTAFPIPFPFFASADVAVEVNGATVTGGFSISGTVADGGFIAGTVTFSSGRAAGDVVVIYRDIAIGRATDFPYPNSTLDIRSLNTELDRLTAVQQDQKRTLGLTMRAPAGEAPLSAMPGASARAGKLLGFDSNGGPVATDGVAAGGLVVSTWGAALINRGTSNDALADSLTHTRDEAGAVAVPLKHIIRREWVRPEDFGAPHDGASDDRPAIQAAINTGENIEFGPYDYRIGAALTMTTRGQRVRGQGQRTRLLSTNLTADHFLLGDGTNALGDLQFRDFVLWATVAKTGGYAFNGRRMDTCQWMGVQAGCLAEYGNAGLTHRLANGWFFDGFGRCALDRDCAATVASYGVKASGRPGIDAAELEIDADLILCGVGTLVGGGAGGVYFNGEMSRCTVGIQIDKSLVATDNREIFLLPRAIIDSCDDYGLVVAAGCGTLDMTGAWLTSSGQYNPAGQGVGLYVAPGNNTTIRATGLRLYNNRAAGANIASGRLQLTGSAIHDNGIGLLLAPTLDNYQIEGNNFFSNATHISGVPALLTPAKQIRNNLGFVTESQGVATVPNGQATLVVNHGLSVAPQQVQLTPVSPVQDGKHYIAAISPTTFTIDLGVVATASRNFYWRAIV